VADTGPGLPAEVKAQMFSPFFTTKAPGAGTGLGLFVSYGIAEAHGGTLTAESQPGEGAMLILALPVAVAAPQSRDSATPAPAKARRILVVDDDPAVRRVVAVLFSRDGHRVDAAANGAEALRLASAERFDLIIADRLAAADGVPIATALARLPGDAPRRMILSTSDTRPGSEEWLAAQGPRMLRKPFDLRDLKKAAEEVFGESDTLPHGRA
jgi:CheY-like chemotaxis protein